MSLSIDRILMPIFDANILREGFSVNRAIPGNLFLSKQFLPIGSDGRYQSYKEEDIATSSRVEIM